MLDVLFRRALPGEEDSGSFCGLSIILHVRLLILQPPPQAQMGRFSPLPGASAMMVLKVMVSSANAAVLAHAQTAVAAPRMLNVSLETWVPTNAFATKAGVGMASSVWPSMNVGWILEVAAMRMLSAAMWGLDRVDAHVSWASLETVTSAAPSTPVV